MQFVIIFLGSVFIVAGQRYFHQIQPREMPWMMGSYSAVHHPITNKYRQPLIIIYSKPRLTPEIYSSQDFSWENQQRNANNWFHTENVDTGEDRPNKKHFEEFSNFPDVQSRGKVSAVAEKVNPRFYFGTSSVTLTNPFLKTATFTVSSTLTVSSVVKCIVPADFAVGVVPQSTPCRRKRDQEILESFGTAAESRQVVIIDPSQPQPLTSTTLPSFDLSHQQENRRLPSDEQQIINHEIISSKDGESLLPESMSSTTSRNNTFKEKRFLFFNSVFVVSKTVTSYSFVSKTSTVTVDVAIGGGLNCLPTGYVVC